MARDGRQKGEKASQPANSFGGAVPLSDEPCWDIKSSDSYFVGRLVIAEHSGRIVSVMVSVTMLSV